MILRGLLLILSVYEAATGVVPSARGYCQNCLPVSECPALYKLAKEKKFDDLRKQKRCGFESNEILLCCPQREKEEEVDESAEEETGGGVCFLPVT